MLSLMNIKFKNRLKYILGFKMKKCNNKYKLTIIKPGYILDSIKLEKNQIIWSDIYGVN